MDLFDLAVFEVACPDDFQRHMSYLTDKIEKRPDGCWIWKGATSNGRPVTRFGLGRDNRHAVRALLFQLEFSTDIPPGRIAHLKPACDPQCVNPYCWRQIPVAS